MNVCERLGYVQIRGPDWRGELEMDEEEEEKQRGGRQVRRGGVVCRSKREGVGRVRSRSW